MRSALPIILVAALVLIAAGVLLTRQDPATAYTADRGAWEAFLEGDRLLQAFRYAEAEEQLEIALKLDENLAPARIALAELNGRRGLSDVAKKHYAIADSLVAAIDDDESRLLLEVRLSPTEMSSHHGHRDSLLALAKSQAPDNLVVLTIEAMNANRDGDVERTESIWKHVLEINPNYAAAYNFLGYLYLAQGRYDEAETAMRRYAFVAPDLANPHDSLGEVLMTGGRYEEAEVEFRTALAMQPDFFHSMLNIARIYILRGEVTKANALYDRVRTEVTGSDWERHLEIRRLGALFDHRVNEQLDHYAARYLTEFPDHYYAPHVRIWQLLARNQVEGALALIDSMSVAARETDDYRDDPLKRNRVEIERLRYTALASEATGDHPAAARQFQQALDLRGDAPLHLTVFERVHLAWNLVPMGNLDVARAEIHAALTVNPRLPEGVLVAAAIEAAAGEAGEAHRLLDTLERILERADPDYPALVDAQRLRAELPDPGRI